MYSGSETENSAEFSLADELIGAAPYVTMKFYSFFFFFFFTFVITNIAF